MTESVGFRPHMQRLAKDPDLIKEIYNTELTDEEKLVIRQLDKIINEGCECTLCGIKHIS